MALDGEASGAASMLVVDDDNRVADPTIEAGRMLGDLRTAGVDEDGPPAIVRNVVTRALASRSSTHIATGVHGTYGVWRRVTAIPSEGERGSVTVMIGPPQSTAATERDGADRPPKRGWTATTSR